MAFKSTLDSLKVKLQAMVTTDSSAEQIEQINGMISELDSLETDHTQLVDSEAKLKEVVVRMVQTQGNGDKPADDSTGSKPKSIDECVAEIQAQKGGK